MSKRNIGNLYDPRQGDQAIRMEGLRLPCKPTEPPRTNYFSIYFIESGSGSFWADASKFYFHPNSLLFFVPYQHIRFAPTRSVHGELIQFHANFLCVETFHAEVGCSGILFNDPYGDPVVTLDEHARSEVLGLVERIRNEQGREELAFGEVMLAYLKVLLILATRLKTPQAAACGPGLADLRHPVLAQLRDLIEANYQTLHSPADYAKRLHVTPKTLGRIVRDHLGTTPSDLIRNRILIHAKWQLLHTLKSVKEISREVGFSDELYFSRLFKKATGYSPTFFRDFETEIRGGSNLSMLSSHAPILRSGGASDS
ncbi:Arabinose operon regulatory protein [Anatilimnocola aggregata]|uniref:Arabinose operon regulatory protein n=1 Tax=Anatilimnocola aggregata TaxID=2528021 RepID=A0A517YFU5_9BACT|nr:AraC family transcriptional regulator [Anatilimnocola aggregata]QDU29042.1 Arabinose operon regulatory protein [Anatilimnocola aggregata]